MGTAHIDCTIDAAEGGVPLFQAECTAEIEYQVDAGALADWSIRDFRFEAHRPEWDDNDKVYRYRKSGEAWCSDVFRPALLHYVNKKALEQDLIDLLTATGEMTSTNASLRAEHHQEVL